MNLNSDFRDYETFKQKLEQNEKIIEILGGVSSFIPDLYVINNNNDFSEAIGPLLKLYAKQLILINENNGYSNIEILNNHPSLKCWLKSLNVSDNSLKIILKNSITFNFLYTKNENDLREFLFNLNIRDQELRVICSAFYYLKMYYDNLVTASKYSINNETLINNVNEKLITKKNTNHSDSTIIDKSCYKNININDISNDHNKKINSYNLTVPQTNIPIHLTSSSSSSTISQISSTTTTNSRAKHQRKSESDITQNLINSQKQQSNLNVSPVHYPPGIANSNYNSSPNKNYQIAIKSKKANIKVTTPPPSRKNSTSNMYSQHNINLTHQNNSNLQSFMSHPSHIHRSPSYDSQTRNKIEISSSILQQQQQFLNSNDVLKNKIVNPQQNLDILFDSDQRRLSTEGSDSSSKLPSGQTSPINIPSPIKPSNKSASLSIPQSPKQVIQNTGKHKWTNTLKVTNCNHCQKKMIIGMKCKKCKIRCHKDCGEKYQSNCIASLPIISKVSSFSYEPTNILNNNINCETLNKRINKSQYDSSSNASSCNSSGPNSPNNLKLPNKKIPSFNSQQFSMTINTNNNILNQNTTPSSPTATATASSSSNLTSPHSLKPKSEFFPPNDNDSNDSKKLINYSIDLKTNNSEQTNTTNNIQYDFGENIETQNGDNFDQDSNDVNQSSVIAQSLKECNITYSEITEKILIGEGLFGKTYKCQWHGPHAVKELELDSNIPDDSEKFELFKQEILNLNKTRHANLILFVGACMEHPKLAIVMSLCRGVTLFRYLHFDAYPKPNFDWTINIATQIAQGMGYLHTKKMLHKDLKSKNIFIDGNKAVISDFGLVATAQLCKKLQYSKSLIKVKKESLFYLSPEIMRALGGAPDKELPFSEASDIYAFGTVWYELFCYEYPFSIYDVHTIIYLVGSGSKHLSPHIQITKELKNILLKCWSKEPNIRPQFSNLLEIFRAVPKRRLYRSPSHPTQIGRSLEAIHINDKLK